MFEKVGYLCNMPLNIFSGLPLRQPCVQRGEFTPIYVQEAMLISYLYWEPSWYPLPLKNVEVYLSPYPDPIRWCYHTRQNVLPPTQKHNIARYFSRPFLKPCRILFAPLCLPTCDPVTFILTDGPNPRPRAAGAGAQCANASVLHDRGPWSWTLLLDSIQWQCNMTLFWYY